MLKNLVTDLKFTGGNTAKNLRYGKDRLDQGDSGQPYIVKDIPNLDDYHIKNIRDYCKEYKSENKCNIDKHCMWASNNCKLQLKYDKIIEFLKRT